MDHRCRRWYCVSPHPPSACGVRLRLGEHARFRSLFAAMLEQHPGCLGSAVERRERGREDLGLHIIMSTNATVNTAPTVAMKRGDKRKPQVQDRPLSRSFCNTSMYCFVISLRTTEGVDGTSTSAKPKSGLSATFNACTLLMPGKQGPLIRETGDRSSPTA